MSTALFAPRTILFLPANREGAVAKARTLPVDMVALDLEDAVKPADKDAARAAAVAAAGSFGDIPVTIRCNTVDSPWFDDDLAAIAGSAADYVLVPKAETPAVLAHAARVTGKPVLAMIETPAGVLDVRKIAAADAPLAGLVIGTNDLGKGLALPPGAGRGSMTTALQMVVLAARARGVWAIDGVHNRLDDAEALRAECAEGRALGFDGKSLIHPGQVDIARAAFSPTQAECDDARALIAAASGGAERYQGAMIETLHVEQARALLAREA